MTFADILADEFDNTVPLSATIEDTPIDSLEYLQFLNRCEKEFDTRLADEDIARAVTFADLEHLFQFHHWKKHADVSS